MSKEIWKNSGPKTIPAANVINATERAPPNRKKAIPQTTAANADIEKRMIMLNSIHATIGKRISIWFNARERSKLYAKHNAHGEM